MKRDAPHDPRRRSGGCTTRRLLRLLLALGAAAPFAGEALASATVPQTWLPGRCIPQFATTLPVFGPGYNATLPRVDAVAHPSLRVTMKEVSQQVLPAFVPPKGCPAVNLQPTAVWTYETVDATTGQVLGPALWPGVTVEALRGVPTTVDYVNQLPSFAGGGVVQGLVSSDQTIDFADPLNAGAMPCLNNPLAAPGCALPYLGPVPTAPHLHGGEVPSQFDGGPLSWFTPDGIQGKSYSSAAALGPGKARYVYPNAQEAGTLWFHDHAMGSTRTNVYSGLAAFYFLRDPANEPASLPSGAYEVELAIQDRQFDTRGQLYFPDGSDPSCGKPNASNPCWNGAPPNPAIHPFWNPEFVGDVVVVNGAPWPTFAVEPRRYRLRLIGGANARAFELSFGDPLLAEASPRVWVIGSDDGYLDAPVPVQRILLAPGERADLIVDFTGLAGNVTVKNSAPVPYPDGVWPVAHPVPQGSRKARIVAADQPWMANVMRFLVTEPARGADTSCDPAAGGCARPVPSVRLASAGAPAAGVTVDGKRQLVLKEVMGKGGPTMVLLNNTYFDGMMSPAAMADFASSMGVTELPRVGSTELWEIANLTMDTHPIHTHLVQFQIVDRQPFAQSPTNPAVGYPGAWAAAFGTGPTPLPAGCLAGAFCPGYGPPLPYGTANADGAVGGNPAFSPFLAGAARLPEAWESGWKDTARMNPGEITRILVRWAPSDAPLASAAAGVNLFPFDPTQGPGYVWHCHIIDHEDNDMMRPFAVAP